MYIGVTGFTHNDQVRLALSQVPTDPVRQVMIGVLASYKTIQGLPAGNPKRYPVRENIADIFRLDWRALNLVHYNTRDQAELAAQLWGALKWGGPFCDGLQLNIVWPDPKVLRGMKRSRPEVVIVLQINRGAMAACKNDAELVAKRFGDQYSDIVDYVLVDASGGAGVPLSPIEAAAYLVELDRAIDARASQSDLVVAGGLCAENLRQLMDPIRMLVPCGIDAEGALRTDDILDNEKVDRYLRAAYALL